MIRTFIGIKLDEETLANLSKEVSYLKTRLPRVRWSQSENMHITLKFIGNVPTNEIADIFTVADKAAANAFPFTLNIQNVGCFPNIVRPRVVWAGCGQGADECKMLAGSLEQLCEDLGYPRERKGLTPHVTIGRVRHPSDAEGISELVEDAVGTDYGMADIDAVTVFMSELKKSGPVYTPMHTAYFGG